MNFKKNRKPTLLLAAAAVFLATTGIALATAPSGILSGTVLARGAFVDPVDIKFKVIDGSVDVANVRQAQDTVVQQIVIAPGGNTGWHSHPGPVVVLVKAGALTFYDGDDPTCTPRTYVAGQVFIDRGQGHRHIAKNLSASENLDLYAVYFDVPPGGAYRQDAPNPGNCNF